MKKIFSEKIERYLGIEINRRLSPEERRANEAAKCTLQLFLREHPAADYADELLAMVKELSCDRGHAPGCSGERPEYRCKCGWREMKPKAQALINEIEGKK